MSVRSVGLGNIRSADTDLTVMNEFIEKRPIMDHRLPEILSGSLIISVAKGDFVGGVIVLDYHGVMN